MTNVPKSQGASFDYFAVITRGTKDQRFVRVAEDSNDNEFAEMRKDPGRTFPFVIFDLSTHRESPDYIVVLCNMLRPVDSKTSDLLAQKWK